MRTPKAPISLITVTCLLLCISAASANAPALNELFYAVLDSAATDPLPFTICPLIQAAESAETSEVSALQFAVMDLERKLIGDFLTVDRQVQARIERQKKACAQIKSELTRIKNSRTDPAQWVREAKEGGRSLTFHGRCDVAPWPYEDYDGDYDTELIRDNLGQVPGDCPHGPIAAVVSLTSAGCQGFSAPVFNGKLIVWGSESSYYRDYPWCSLYFDDFAYDIGSFQAFPGKWTGPNRATLNPFGSAPKGRYNFNTNRFEIQFEGMFTNDRYDQSMPILFFASIFGAAPDSYEEYFTAEAPVSADVPMLVPLRGDIIELGRPKIMGAHVLEFDPNGGILTLLENTTFERNADIAMLRYSDGSYAINPVVDQVLDGYVQVEPLKYAGQSPQGVYNFNDADVRISVDVGSGNFQPQLTGRLRNVTLNTITGGFFADLDVVKVVGESTILAQIYVSGGTKAMQLAVGSAVYDIVEVTGGFNTSGRLPYPELFHIGVIDRCDAARMRADFDGNGAVNFTDFANLAKFWLQNGLSIGDIAPQPDGDQTVNKLDFASLANRWLDRCY